MQILRSQLPWSTGGQHMRNNQYLSELTPFIIVFMIPILYEPKMTAFVFTRKILTEELAGKKGGDTCSAVKISYLI